MLLLSTSFVDKEKYHAGRLQLSETPLFAGKCIYILSDLEKTSCFCDRTQCDARGHVASTATVGQRRGMGHPCIFSWCATVPRPNSTPSLLIQSIQCSKCLHFPFKWLDSSYGEQLMGNQQLQTSVGIIKHSITQRETTLLLRKKHTLLLKKRRDEKRFYCNQDYALHSCTKI
jgi:hypothetical protein